MKTANHLSFFTTCLLASLFLLLASSCEQNEPVDPSMPHEHSVYDPHTKSTTYYGPAVPVGGGVARVRAEISKNGEPLSIGVVLSDKAVTNLPHEMTEYVLQLPKKARLTPFDHFTLDWNPHGHEPDHIYTHPHFDMHFYTISQDERASIGFNDPLAENLPDPQYMPASYIALPGSIPMMGKHWVDPASPELNGADFTQTFLWGSYNKKVIFLEPMITLDYLLSKPNKNFELQQPAAYQQSGKYYPTSYSIRYDEKRKEHAIDLLGLIKR
ncbi:DUF5602 domain-containing protein [Cesiribacter sp. SM1]|uniref:DUF5602 domain-containing protein n=1 Tax=Cesiribacter sp. SM1 TaxID=2861196 RepID=UPI001CD3A9A6|nr:DUF5602 domain-containing protein [Cesiribacter sp. SM1]